MVLILVPLIGAGGVLLAGIRQGRTYRWMYLLALALLAVAAAFWWFYAGNPEGGPEITWLVGLLVAVLAFVTVLSTRWGARLLLWSAFVVPLAFLAYTVWLYLVGEGVSDGVGGQEPFVGMAFVSLMLGVAMYAVPAVATWVVLREGIRPVHEAAGAPPGWYPDPGVREDPAATRYWDGTAWTERTAGGGPAA
jgi:peptidoglycan/LPS O-acetylase OafA/YrhL